MGYQYLILLIILNIDSILLLIYAGVGWMIVVTSFGINSRHKWTNRFSDWFDAKMAKLCTEKIVLQHFRCMDAEQMGLI